MALMSCIFHFAPPVQYIEGYAVHLPCALHLIHRRLAYFYLQYTPGSETCGANRNKLNDGVLGPRPFHVHLRCKEGFVTVV